VRDDRDDIIAAVEAIVKLSHPGLSTKPRADETCLLCLVMGHISSACGPHTRSLQCRHAAIRESHLCILDFSEQFLRSIGSKTAFQKLLPDMNPDRGNICQQCCEELSATSGWVQSGGISLAGGGVTEGLGETVSSSAAAAAAASAAQWSGDI
jgi:hypothetical protein